MATFDDFDSRGNELDGHSVVAESDPVYLTPCIYCGIVCDSIDHIPPRSMRAQLSGVELAAIGQQEVPSCRECNSVLGGRPILTITERRAYIKAALHCRYKSYLRIPNWTEDELKEFGESLRGMIRRNMAVRDIVRQRIAWRG